MDGYSRSWHHQKQLSDLRRRELEAVAQSWRRSRARWTLAYWVAIIGALALCIIGASKLVLDALAQKAQPIPRDLEFRFEEEPRRTTWTVGR